MMRDRDRVAAPDRQALDVRPEQITLGLQDRPGPIEARGAIDQIGVGETGQAQLFDLGGARRVISVRVDDPLVLTPALTLVWERDAQRVDVGGKGAHDAQALDVAGREHLPAQVAARAVDDDRPLAIAHEGPPAPGRAERLHQVAKALAGVVKPDIAREAFVVAPGPELGPGRPVDPVVGDGRRAVRTAQREERLIGRVPGRRLGRPVVARDGGKVRRVLKGGAGDLGRAARHDRIDRVDIARELIGRLDLDLGRGEERLGDGGGGASRGKDVPDDRVGRVDVRALSRRAAHLHLVLAARHRPVERAEKALSGLGARGRADDRGGGPGTRADGTILDLHRDGRPDRLALAIDAAEAGGKRQNDAQLVGLKLARAAREVGVEGRPDRLLVRVVGVDGQGGGARRQAVADAQALELIDGGLADLQVDDLDRHRPPRHQVAQEDVVAPDLLDRLTLERREDPVSAKGDRHRRPGPRLVARPVDAWPTVDLRPVEPRRRDERIDRQIAGDGHRGRGDGGGELAKISADRAGDRAADPDRDGEDRDLQDRAQHLVAAVAVRRAHADLDHIAGERAGVRPEGARDLRPADPGHGVRFKHRVEAGGGDHLGKGQAGRHLDPPDLVEVERMRRHGHAHRRARARRERRARQGHRSLGCAAGRDRRGAEGRLAGPP